MSGGRITGICLVGLLIFAAASGGLWISMLLGMASVAAAAIPWRSIVSTPVSQPTISEGAEGKPKPNLPTQLACLFAFGCIVAFAVEAANSPEGRAKSAQRARERQEAALLKEQERDAASREERRKGFHCLNNVDGSHWDMQEAIKGRLRNPGSFDHVETAIMPRDKKGLHTIVMQYRAENGFGGTNLERAIGIIDGTSCDLLKLSM